MNIKTFLEWESSCKDFFNFVFKGDLVDRDMIQFLTDNRIDEKYETFSIMIRSWNKGAEFLVFTKEGEYWRYCGLINQLNAAGTIAA